MGRVASYFSLRTEAQVQGEAEFVVVANRLPVNRVRREGTTTWRSSPGGLVSALAPILRERSGDWIGWPGFAGDVPEPFEFDGIRNRPVALTKRELGSFYEGFCNRTIWPLYHDAIRPPIFHRNWWRPYVEVNKRFADAAASTAARGATVWIHDYQLQLVPGQLRALRPDLRIGFFLHIPFPPVELFAQLPWRTEILEGLLGADVVGFQTRLGARNFRELSRRFCNASPVGGALRFEGRKIRSRAFPISIDVEQYRTLAQDEETAARTAEFKRRVGKRRILLGVDRLDYTKGIDTRLKAFGELLRSGRASGADCVFVQVAVPSRERVAEYKELRSNVGRIVGNINGEFGEIGQPVIHYLRRSQPMDQLVPLYAAADVMVVTPFRDGMNLVAKEYVASRPSPTGALILSEFAGAADELRSALLVNPHDVDGLVDAMDRALAMKPIEQARRMRALQRAINRNTVYDWAASFVDQLSDVAT
jgi:trehalose 6-phosphate synthase